MRPGEVRQQNTSVPQRNQRMQAFMEAAKSMVKVVLTAETPLRLMYAPLSPAPALRASGQEHLQ